MSSTRVPQVVDGILAKGTLDVSDVDAIRDARGENTSIGEREALQLLVEANHAGKVVARPRDIEFVDTLANATFAARVRGAGSVFAAMLLLPFNVIYRMNADEGRNSPAYLAAGIGANIALAPITFAVGAAVGAHRFLQD